MCRRGEMYTTVVSSTVTYIDNYLKSDSFDKCNNSRCKQALQTAARVCTNVETLQKITEILLSTDIHKIAKIVIDTSTQPSSSGTFSFTASFIKNLNWEAGKMLTSPATLYDAIKDFTKNAGKKLHPCVVVE